MLESGGILRQIEVDGGRWRQLLENGDGVLCLISDDCERILGPK